MCRGNTVFALYTQVFLTRADNRQLLEGVYCSKGIGSVTPVSYPLDGMYQSTYNYYSIMYAAYIYQANKEHVFTMTHIVLARGNVITNSGQSLIKLALGRRTVKTTGIHYDRLSRELTQA